MTEEVRGRYVLAMNILEVAVNAEPLLTVENFDHIVQKAMCLGFLSNYIFEGIQCSLDKLLAEEGTTKLEVVPGITFHCARRGGGYTLSSVETTFFRISALPEAGRTAVEKHRRDYPSELFGLMRCEKDLKVFMLASPENVKLALKDMRAKPEERAQEID